MLMTLSFPFLSRNHQQYITVAQVNRFTIFFAIAAFGGRKFDNTREERSFQWRSLLTLSFFISPLIHLYTPAGVGPVIAAFVNQRAGWRWNMRVQAILVAVVLIFTVLFVPETNRSVLEARAGKVRKNKKALFLSRIYGPWKYSIDPIAFFVCLYLSILYGVSIRGFIWSFPSPHTNLRWLNFLFPFRLK